MSKNPLSAKRSKDLVVEGFQPSDQWHWANIRPGSWIQLVDMFFAIGATAKTPTELVVGSKGP